MLIFVDETWQTVGGTPVGALGAVAIPTKRYNAFCREVYAVKASVLGASEVTDSEIKGQNCFAKSAFKRDLLHGDSYWLEAARQILRVIQKYDGRTFGIWTHNPTLLDLRNPASTSLSKPYKQLLFDLRAFMRNEAKGELGALNFDERQHREDEATARAVSNYLIRTRGSGSDSWDRHFLVIPSFTASSISPGLQAADLVSYLTAQVSDSSERPELEPFVETLKGLRYEFVSANRTRRCLRKVN